MFDTYLSNFSGGEVSEEIFGRFDSDLYKNSLQRCENFLSLIQGPAQYRGGFTFVHPTRLQQTARIERFKFSDSQVYVLEFTNAKLRIYEDAALTLNSSSKTITGITQASPGVITAASHGFATDDEVYIASVGGMTELNGRFFRVVYINANTFSLKDSFGNAVNTAVYTAYTSGGTATTAYSLTSPYLTADLFQFQFDQEGNIAYFSHRGYAPYKLTRVSATSWTFATYTRTNDPFIAAAKTITGVTKANPGVVTSAGHGYASGYRIAIASISGMTELNGNSYLVVYIDANTFSLTTLAGVAVDTSAYGAYTSGGTAKRETFPRAVAFYEGCVYFAGSDDNPNRGWRSRGPDTTGATRYDDFTTGTDADHAIIFNAANGSGQISWLAGLRGFLALGTEGGVLGLDGNTDAAITPTNFRIRPIDPVAVQGDIMPVINGQSIFYMQRGSRTLRSFDYDLVSDNYKSTDRQFLAPHLTVGGITQLAIQRWKTDLLWAVRADGVLLCLTVKPKEDVSGWHRHSIGGTDARVLSIAVEPQSTGYDRLYAVVERTINSITTTHIEYLNDPYEGVRKDDYFTGGSDEDGDTSTYLDALYSAQQDSVYLDSALTYDGSATDTVTGLWHLEGETVAVVADGSIHADVVVTNGAITLAREASVIHVGYKYRGIMIPLNLIVAGQVQNSIAFGKNISMISLVVSHTIGVKYGTSLYDLQEILASEIGQDTNSPPAPFTGTLPLPIEDSWTTDKRIIYVQDEPYPCMLNALSVTIEVGEK
jgi:hypothetical protein